MTVAFISETDLDMHRRNAGFTKFDICQHHAHSSAKPTILFVNGFLSEQGCDHANWLEAINRFFPNHPCYELKWDASSLSKLIEIAPILTALPMPYKIPASSAVLLKQVATEWYAAYTTAAKVGVVLAEILQKTDAPNGSILMGHSLGAKVIYHTLTELGQKECPCVKEAYLLGGAVTSTTEHWAAARQGTTGNIYNIYSTNDAVLKYCYNASVLGKHSPAGRTEFGNEAVPIHNIDASSFVNGHSEYKEKLQTVFSLIHNYPVEAVMAEDDAKLNEYSKDYSESGLWEKVKGYAKTVGCEGIRNALRLYYVLEDKSIPPKVRLTILGALGYFISPLDLIPDVIPVVGFTDDIAVLAAAIATAAAYITPEMKALADEKLATWFGKDSC